MECEVGWFRNQRAHLQLVQMGLIVWGDGVREVPQKSAILIDLFQAYDTRSKEGGVKRFGRYRG